MYTVSIIDTKDEKRSGHFHMGLFFVYGNTISSFNHKKKLDLTI